MKDLKDYLPEQLEFKLPKGVRFPLVIFEGAKDMNQIRKHLSGAFISENLRGAKAYRLLDEYEKSTIRANYGELLEDEQPVLEAELEAVKEACKKKVKDAEDRLQAVRTQIKDLAFQAKEGTKEFDLPSDSVRMPIDGHYLYYAWINEAFRLVKVDPIPTWDKDNLFNQLETNKAAFKEVLGIDIDEAKNGEVAAQEGAEE